MDPTQNPPATAQHPLGLSRHLIRFDPHRVPVYRFDVVVVGSGVAGSSAALAAAHRGLSVAVVAKAELEETNTRYAQGGMAAVLSSQDSFESHIADTLRVGRGLCDPEVVECVVRGAPPAVDALVGLGTRFDRGAEGRLALSREGGHSHPRIVHAGGDATGLEIQRSLCQALGAHERITPFLRTFALDLLSGPEGEVAGLLGHTARGEFVAFDARSVVLATGGSGQIYRETTNPPVATGDGVAMAFRAGAALRDLEFVQFHPTCLYIAGAARVLISEIVRGAGGVLRDRHGVRFMPEYHESAELAPRDIVSRAVFQRMVDTGDTNVYLDLTNLDGDPHRMFPGISRVCRAFGIDIAREPIPVRPGAHYHIGGIRTDLDGRTSLPGLWAVGECTSSGLHGANRMGSNSLLEGLVLGMRTGSALSERAGSATVLRSFGDSGAAPAAARKDHDISVNIEDLTYSLKSMMWRQLGVQRSGPGMAEAKDKLGFWTRVVQDLAQPGPRSWELLNMLTLAHLTTLSALRREESRGVHFRDDFPNEVEEQRTHSLLTPTSLDERIGAVLIESEPVRESAACHP